MLLAAVGRGTLPGPLLSANAFALTAGPSGQSATADLLVQDQGTQPVDVQMVRVSVSWLTIDAAPSSLQPGAVGRIRMTANPRGLAPGAHRATFVLAMGGPVGLISVLFFVPAGCTPTGLAAQVRTLSASTLVDPLLPVFVEAWSL